MASEPQAPPPGRRISVQMVEDLLGRVQQLIDNRPRGRLPGEWVLQAQHLGDLSAIAALATIAARSAGSQLLAVRWFPLAPELLFRAWTTPELIAGWWSAGRGDVVSVDVDLRVGGSWRCVTATRGAEAAFSGEFREVIADERIVWTETAEGTSEHESVNTVTFTRSGDGTRLAVLLDFGTEAARDAAVGQGIEATVREQLERLGRTAASLR